jgi:DNA-directed RNA polymerase sigma subunit (sigma70/sigma32)
VVRVQLKKVDRLEGMRFLKRDMDGRRLHSYHDVLEDTSAVNPEEAAIRKEAAHEVKRVFERTGIAFRERAVANVPWRRVPSYYADKIVWYRKVDGITLERCGVFLGCTKERVRQIERKFLYSFKHHMVRQIKTGGKSNIQEYERIYGLGIR